MTKPQEMLSRPSPPRGAHLATGRPAWRRAGLVLMAVLVLAACGTAIERRAQHEHQAAERLFAAGYDYIDSRYLHPVDLGELTLGGLRGLRQLDPMIEAAREGPWMMLRREDAVLASFRAPVKNDPTAWAYLTVDLLEAGRAASPGLRQSTHERLYHAIFEAGLGTLDAYSRYAGATDARRNRASREGFGGIGITLSMEQDGVRVVSVMPETPASKAGLRADDHITHVDGQPLKGLGPGEIVDRLRGPEGSVVRLTLRREDAPESIEARIRRTHIVPQTVTSRREDDIGYVRISAFNQDTGKGLAAALRRLRWEHSGPLEGIVLDLRGNPGGLLDQAVAVADIFLTGGRIVSTRGRHPDSNQRFDAGGSDLARGVPVVVLVNGESASSAEIVAAALQDHGRAVVLGTNSYGKGTVQNVIRLPNNGELTLTWSRIHAPSGYSLHRLGVMPTICTSADGEGAERVLASLRGYRQEVNQLFAAWQRVDYSDTETRRRLRTRCPGQSTAPESDLELARQILEDPALYRRALGLSFPAVAEARH